MKPLIIWFHIPVFSFYSEKGQSIKNHTWESHNKVGIVIRHHRKEKPFSQYHDMNGEFPNPKHGLIPGYRQLKQDLVNSLWNKLPYNILFLWNILEKKRPYRH